MAERVCLIDKKKMEYQGIFSVDDLLINIKNYTAKKGYSKKGMGETEIVKKTGRYITHGYELHKKLSDYAKSVIKIKMELKDVKDLEVKKEGYALDKNQGHITFTYDAYLETSFEHKWENTPGFFFVRVLFDKYLFKPFTTNYEAIVKSDFKDFFNEIRGHLNLNKY